MFRLYPLQSQFVGKTRQTHSIAFHHHYPQIHHASVPYITQYRSFSSGSPLSRMRSFTSHWKGKLTRPRSSKPLTPRDMYNGSIRMLKTLQNKSIDVMFKVLEFLKQRYGWDYGKIPPLVHQYRQQIDKKYERFMVALPYRMKYIERRLQGEVGEFPYREQRPPLIDVESTKKQFFKKYHAFTQTRIGKRYVMQLNKTKRYIKRHKLDDIAYQRKQLRQFRFKIMACFRPEYKQLFKRKFQQKIQQKKQNVINSFKARLRAVERQLEQFKLYRSLQARWRQLPIDKYYALWKASIPTKQNAMREIQLRRRRFMEFRKHAKLQKQKMEQDRQRHQQQQQQQQQ